MKGEATGGGVCVGFSFSQHRQESGVGEAGTRQVRETCSLPRWECVGWNGRMGTCTSPSPCWPWPIRQGGWPLSHWNLVRLHRRGKVHCREDKKRSRAFAIGPRAWPHQI